MASVPQSAAGQTVVSPSSHFGSSAYPDIEPATYVGLNFDRFTRFGKEVDDDGNYIWKPYNAINETVGLNAVALSFSGASRRDRLLLYRMVVQAGYGHNEPTKAVQNWIHDQKNLLYVPDSLTRKHIDIGVAADATRWFRGARQTWIPSLFAGGGFSVSTVHQEAFAQAGFRSFPTAARPLGLSLMGRAGLVAGGDAFPSRTLERAYAAGQVSGQLALAQVLDRALSGKPWLVRAIVALIPDVEIVYSGDTGFFKSLDGNPLSERFISGRASWLDDLVQFETWNDTINDKDQGPTGGGRVFVRLPAFASRRWLP